MPKNGLGGGTIIPGKKDIVIPAYTDTELTVRGEPSLLPKNIRAGVNLFEVTGSLVEGTRMETGTITFLNYSVIPRTINISHGMGVAPSNFYLLPENGLTHADDMDNAFLYTIFSINNNTCFFTDLSNAYGGETYLSYSSAITSISKSINDVGITINNRDYLFGAGTFRWIAIV